MQSLAHLSDITFYYFYKTFLGGCSTTFYKRSLMGASRFMVIGSGNSRLTAIWQMTLHKDKMSKFILQAQQTWQSIVTNEKCPFPLSLLAG